MSSRARDVLFVLLGVGVLVLKSQYAGPADGLVHNYGGNVAASFAVYFVVTHLPFPPRFRKLATAALALAVVELFEERFLATYVGWARENGLLARIQAYGRETHVLDGSLQVDLPEGESWLWSGHDRIVVSPTVANKYVSSAAHLAGRGAGRRGSGRS